MSESKARAHLMISGRVQGVFFRAETEAQAHRLGISGWVRNTSDGKVEAVFEGDADDVSEITRWCRTGSAAAKVENVDVTEQNFKGEFDTFSVRS